MKIINISQTTNLPRRSIYFELEHPGIAKNYVASLQVPVRRIKRFLDLYDKGRYLVLEGPITDENGQISEEKVGVLNDVAEKIRNTILNDVPGFRIKLERIIAMHQAVEQLDLKMVPVIDQALKGKTKQRFMAVNNVWLCAKIIRKAMEEGPYSDADVFDKAVNAIIDDQNMISSFLKEIDEWKRKK